MLPSTSSPVENAPTPLSLSGNLVCQPQHLGHAKAGQVTDEPREECPVSPKGEFGMCRVDDIGQERGDMMPPPDLCASDGLNCGELQRWNNRSCDVDTEVTIAQAACDTAFVTSMSQSGDKGEETQEGAWSLPPHLYGDPSGVLEDSFEDCVTVGTKASLPDLCDTSSGARSRVHLGCGLQNDNDKDFVCKLLSPSAGGQPGDGSAKTTSVSQSDGKCKNVDEDMTEVESFSSSTNNDSGETIVTHGENGANTRFSAADSDKASAVNCELGNEETDTSITDEEKCNSRGDCSIGEKVNTGDNFDFGHKDSCEPEGAAGPLEDYLLHDNQQISLVACGITQCDPSFQQDVEMEDISEDEQGINLIKHNLHHSSHPMFNKWPCYFYITREHLPSFSIDSHGRHIGSEAPAMFFPSPSVSRPASQLTEEEQVKIAKRMGLITHLPCGIFDGTKKSGECVICMIDFTVGDRVRYLPCMHTYHTECIDDWLMRSFTCPSCLEPVDAALLNTYGTS
ncbi:uncharacterized protein [Procambarus clarkii]|uniref:uncharacterized protein isoform X2 n=1 Tax=Procambarus clarkii TaxID=6728 RepID=UPI001E67642A|nr:uncharacterized protein LOC123765222 isoform X2 [Procambarus clarkii]